MSSGKGRFLRLLGGLVLREGAVREVVELGPRYRLLVVGGLPAAPYQAGDKLQILLPGDDVRTYTPIGFGAETRLLGYLHADTPGPRWFREASVGTPVRFVGPQRSLPLDAGPAVILGDETSIAVAAAYAQARPGETAAVIVADDLEAARAAAAAVGVSELAVVARAAGPDALLSAARAMITSMHPGQGAERGAAVGITGEARLVQVLRDGLRGEAPRIKTYWAPGKIGLD